jgi:hypothetical protein
MPTPDIIERVKKLQDELGEVQPDTAQAPDIETLRKEIDVVLADPEHAPHYKSLGERLLFHKVGFQNEHPQLAASMESLAETLAKIGL